MVYYRKPKLVSVILSWPEVECKGFFRYYLIKLESFWSSHRAAVMSLTSIHEDVGLIPGLHPWIKGSGIAVSYGSDLPLLWLWHRLAAVTPIRLLAWELPCALGAALKRQKKKKPKKHLVNFFSKAAIHQQTSSAFYRQRWVINLLFLNQSLLSSNYANYKSITVMILVPALFSPLKSHL